jgi:RNA-directed DNA polymerase
MERRETRTQYQPHSNQKTLSGQQLGFFGMNSEKWIRYVRRAGDKSAVLTTPFNLIDEHTLLDGFKLLDGAKAVGIDGISKKSFKEKLEDNLKELTRDLKTGKYRPMPRKETLIPKANGKTRPIAIACFRDKVIEATLAKILNFIYEPMFIRNSFGFRPNKSAHGAIEASFMTLKDNKRPWVAEIDFESFFNTVPHGELLSLMRKRINDKRLLCLIKLLMKNKIVSMGKESWPRVGTPQGSVVSPILSNIYLHYVLDSWFAENFASQEAQMVRYADDAIFMFSTKEKAELFMKALTERMDKYRLKLNQEKTRLTDFRKESHNVFSFLGFSFIWGRQRSKKDSGLKVRTQKEKLVRKADEIKDWIKTNRNKFKVNALLGILRTKLVGHYNYYGYKTNRTKLNYFYSLTTKSLYKWLNRRSQKKSYNRESFVDLIKNKIPRPPEMHLLKPLGVKYANAY